MNSTTTSVELPVSKEFSPFNALPTLSVVVQYIYIIYIFVCISYYCLYILLNKFSRAGGCDALQGDCKLSFIE
jgi:hypothetical protein